jgi:hypothetical protein
MCSPAPPAQALARLSQGVQRMQRGAPLRARVASRRALCSQRSCSTKCTSQGCGHCAGDMVIGRSVSEGCLRPNPATPPHARRSDAIQLLAATAPRQCPCRSISPTSFHVLHAAAAAVPVLIMWLVVQLYSPEGGAAQTGAEAARHGARLGTTTNREGGAAPATAAAGIGAKYPPSTERVGRAHPTHVPESWRAVSDWLLQRLPVAPALTGREEFKRADGSTSDHDSKPAGMGNGGTHAAVATASSGELATATSATDASAAVNAAAAVAAAAATTELAQRVAALEAELLRVRLVMTTEPPAQATAPLQVGRIGQSTPSQVAPSATSAATGDLSATGPH